MVCRTVTPSTNKAPNEKAFPCPVDSGRRRRRRRRRSEERPGQRTQTPSQCKKKSITPSVSPTSGRGPSARAQVSMSRLVPLSTWLIRFLYSSPTQSLSRPPPHILCVSNVSNITPSHNHALRAATWIGIIVASLHLADLVAVVGNPAAGRVPLHLAVVPPDFSDDIVECLVDVDPGLGRCLDELAAEGSRERLTLCFYTCKRLRANTIPDLGLG